MFHLKEWAKIVVQIWTVSNKAILGAHIDTDTYQMQSISRGQRRVHIPIYRREPNHLNLRGIKRYEYRHRII